MTRLLRVMLLALGGVVLVHELITPTLLTPDSPSYLSYSITRTPVYPLFLALVRNLKLAQLIQNLLIVVAAFDLVRASVRLLRCHAVVAAVAFALLVIPSFRAGNVIGTEALSYAGFLALVAALLRFVAAPSLRGAGIVSAWTLGLLLTRPQFLFVLPVLALAATFGLWRLGRREGVLAALLMASVVPAAGLLQSTYNLAIHGRFMRLPFTGEQLFVTAVYVADPHDVLGDTLAPVLDTLVQNRQLDSLRPTGWSRFDHFNLAYNPTIESLQHAYMGGHAISTMSADDWLRFDHDTMRIALQLIRAHTVAFVRFLAKELQEVEGQFLLVIVLFGGLSLQRFAVDKNGATLLPFFVAALCLCNYALILLVEPLAARYVLYTDALFPPVVLMWVDGQWRRA